MVLQIYIQGKERGYWKQVNTFCKNIGFICCFDVVDIFVCLCFMSGKGIRICSLEKKDEITLLQRILKFPLTINRISNISIVFAQFHLQKIESDTHFRIRSLPPQRINNHSQQRRVLARITHTTNAVVYDTHWHRTERACLAWPSDPSCQVPVYD